MTCGQLCASLNISTPCRTVYASAAYASVHWITLCDFRRPRTPSEGRLGACISVTRQLIVLELALVRWAKLLPIVHPAKSRGEGLSGDTADQFHDGAIFRYRDNTDTGFHQDSRIRNRR